MSKEAMIVLASDHVGLKVVEFLGQRREPVSALGLSAQNRGGFNQQIESVYRRAYPKGVLVSDADLKDEDFSERLSVPEPELGILAWWPNLVKGRLLSLPTKGWLNFHPSYLPFNRGKHPNFWALVDDTPCGVSLHFIDSGVDSGDVVARRRLETTWEDTGETVYRKSRDLIVELFKEEFDRIRSGALPRVKQDLAEGTSHRAKEIEEASRIDLDGCYSARKLLNILRARTFPPHPAAYFVDNGKRYSVQVTIREMKERADG
jgi:methionyl-tRNA formyltransferase